jgi:hypothetical protein
MCAGLFSYHFMHIYIVRRRYGPHFCARSSFNQHRKGRAVREKTARLRALRLDKEAAEKNEGVAADFGQPLVARKKANHGC